jgi:5'-deoxynucleotidase YfbR-like HD superfamily hydrolase
MQGRFGRALDLVDPTVEQVDFVEICMTLANINRFNGCAEPPVSVAYHSMIVCDLADEALKPWALVHDFHESRVGDIATPAAEALAAIARDLAAAAGYGHIFGRTVINESIKEFKRRHDAVIWKAAGLTPPTPEQRNAIKVADLRALLTERRDFMRPKPKDWHPAIEALEPSPTIYLPHRFGMNATQIAWSLMDRCNHYLPALQLRAAA